MTSKEALKQCLAEAKNNESGTIENLAETMKVESEKFKDVKMISLKSLFSDKDMSDTDNLAAVFAKYDNQVFAIQRSNWTIGNNMVPATTKLMRDESQTLVGISAVSGGA